MQVLEVEQLQKTYRSGGKTVEAVRNVSFNIANCEVLAFLGANGAGKTTTIKMIAGLILPDRGQVRIAGRDPHRHSIALKSVGAVLEGNRNVYWRLTPEENLEYFGVLRGLSGYVARQRAKSLLERFELIPKRNTIVQNLSRGMQQKLAIAVALIHEPQLLLLDEPTLGLDVEATQTVKRLVREIASEGRAILLTTHQLDIAEELSDRVAIIKQGEIVVQERTETLIQQFSGDAYRIDLEQELDSDRISKLSAIDAAIEGKTVFVRQTEWLYQALEILKPMTIIRVEKDQANLVDVFLKLVKK
ncbi:ABC transporter ATP-binding protein [Leptolyngbya sp. NIES-2104]|uniref:ABC transporter ATP-binding protein n=1 Tax=Leptolyngbya sp. NIES-2104 TaxID=1552121 RepID=UPI0006EC870C|nr:ABC transporter ATP-binding protein [Leptolyngbya sp. NIES-2104]GAP98641.1 drug exporter-1 ABC transporter (DrugE1) family, ATP-binding protein [Leptolyngbya sp. NIES-2104]